MPNEPLISLPGPDLSRDFQEPALGFAAKQVRRTSLVHLQPAPQQDGLIFQEFHDKDVFSRLTPEEIGHSQWSTITKLRKDLKAKWRLGMSTQDTSVEVSVVKNHPGPSGASEPHIITASVGNSQTFIVFRSKDKRLLGCQSLRLRNLANRPTVFGPKDHGSGFTKEPVHINITRPSAVAAALGITEEIGEIHLITVCSGFNGNMQAKLQDFDDSEFNPSEVTVGLCAGNGQNISVAVNTLKSETLPETNNFMVGIFEGHRGRAAVRYFASNICSLFTYFCSLSYSQYIKRPDSVARNLDAYTKGNPQKFMVAEFKPGIQCNEDIFLLSANNKQIHYKSPSQSHYTGIEVPETYRSAIATLSVNLVKKPLRKPTPEESALLSKIAGFEIKYQGNDRRRFAYALPRVTKSLVKKALIALLVLTILFIVFTCLPLGASLAIIAGLSKLAVLSAVAKPWVIMFGSGLFALGAAFVGLVGFAILGLVDKIRMRHNHTNVSFSNEDTALVAAVEPTASLSRGSPTMLLGAQTAPVTIPAQADSPKNLTGGSVPSLYGSAQSAPSSSPPSPRK